MNTLLKFSVLALCGLPALAQEMASLKPELKYAVPSNNTAPYRTQHFPLAPSAAII